MRRTKPATSRKFGGFRGDTIAILGVGVALLGVMLASWADAREFQAESCAEHAAIRQEIRDLRAELKGDIESLRTEMRNDMNALRKELHNDMDVLRKELRSDMGKLDDRLRTVEIGVAATRSTT